MTWTLGHAVSEVERSHDRIVVEETATVGAVLIFVASALVVAFAFENLVGVMLAVWFACLGLYASVSSSFVADRKLRTFVVTRRVAKWSFEKSYKAEMID
jgi:hypothetical protein